ncbi:hypothetical protein PIB30_002561 [Stylosanthes scabra]|uniref:Uncharacterized protein n=1 Tax=Stylosanthes scabra TaxID=79078 RepID=A0ABU6Z1Q9_9FABA|nr:hypothetical protein [Stylosanthes scabra]
MQIVSRTKEKSAAPVSKEDLGRATWTFLHTLAAQIGPPNLVVINLAPHPVSPSVCFREFFAELAVNLYKCDWKETTSFLVRARRGRKRRHVGVLHPLLNLPNADAEFSITASRRLGSVEDPTVER